MKIARSIVAREETQHPVETKQHLRSAFAPDEQKMPHLLGPIGEHSARNRAKATPSFSYIYRLNGNRFLSWIRAGLEWIGKKVCTGIIQRIICGLHVSEYNDEFMMKCEQCQKVDATIHLTQVIDGRVEKLNLCPACAQHSGINLNAPISITDVLLGLGTDPTPSAPEFDLSCGRCQLTRSEFKKRARLGCPECYHAFMGELSSLTKAMHHSGQHVGKIPARQGNEARLTAQVAALQKEIKMAISKEQYEEAANLRDKIRALKIRARSEQEGGSDDAG